MRTFVYRVEVQAETQEQADQVMVERIEHDEKLGFDYRIDWERPVTPEEVHPDNICWECPEVAVDDHGYCWKHAPEVPL